jgi:hypothetical protein
MSTLNGLNENCVRDLKRHISQDGHGRSTTLNEIFRFWKNKCTTLLKLSGARNHYPKSWKLTIQVIVYIWPLALIPILNRDWMASLNEH